MSKDLNNSQNNYFPSPSGNNNELSLLIDSTSKILVNWFSQTNKSNPFPDGRKFNCTLPDEFGADKDILFREIKSLIETSFNPSHPGSLAHLDPQPLSISIIGDLISGSLNNN